jgi:hypothetical protein
MADVSLMAIIPETVGAGDEDGPSRADGVTIAVNVRRQFEEGVEVS